MEAAAAATHHELSALSLSLYHAAPSSAATPPLPLSLSLSHPATPPPRSTHSCTAYRLSPCRLPPRLAHAFPTRLRQPLPLQVFCISLLATESAFTTPCLSPPTSILHLPRQSRHPGSLSHITPSCNTAPPRTTPHACVAQGHAILTSAPRQLAYIAALRAQLGRPSRHLTSPTKAFAGEEVLRER